MVMNSTTSETIKLARANNYLPCGFKIHMVNDYFRKSIDPLVVWLIFYKQNFLNSINGITNETNTFARLFNGFQIKLANSHFPI
jgi:hypothetical protein